MTNRTIDSQFEHILLPPNPGDLDDGGQGPQISKEIVEKTREYMDQMRQTLSREKGIDLGDPFRIMRDLEGGVDVHWHKIKEYDAVMNVPVEGKVNYCWRMVDGSDILNGTLNY